MITRADKEIRDLMPAVLITLCIIVLPYLIWRRQVEGLGIIMFGLGCAIMAASSFGNELHQRTLSLVLSQPIRRAVLWREKMMVLALGMAISLVALYVCLALVYEHMPYQFGIALALIPLCAFCTTPFWTLLTRSGISGVVFSIAMPGILTLLYLAISERFLNHFAYHPHCMVALFLVYSTLCYWLGYARFQRFELQDRAGRELVMPARLQAVMFGALRRIVPHNTGSFTGLLLKEIRLQQASFLLAGSFCLVPLVSAGLRGQSRALSEATLTIYSAIYVIVFPFLVGALAVAEERGWGVAEWQLTLPVSAFKQWVAKMLVSLGTSLVFGALLPLIIYVSYSWFFIWPTAEAEESLEWPTIVMWSTVWTLGQLWLTSVAVYTGSFSNSTLRAILLAFAVALGMLFSIYCGATLFFAGHASSANGDHSIGWLILLGLAGLLTWIQRLAFSNYREHGLPAHRFVFQVLGLCLVITSVTIIVREWR